MGRDKRVKLAMVKKMKLCPNGEVQNILQDQRVIQAVQEPALYVW
jgi:hypothetical protein